MKNEATCRKTKEGKIKPPQSQLSSCLVTSFCPVSIFEHPVAVDYLHHQTKIIWQSAGQLFCAYNINMYENGKLISVLMVQR
jgi:hypothetical protein